MLKIIRKDNATDKEMIYDIIINNDKFDSIKNNELKSYNLNEGTYKIKIKSSSFSSKTITFNLNKGQIISFSCGPKYKNNVFSKLLYKLFFQNSGIYIKLDQDLYL